MDELIPVVLGVYAGKFGFHHDACGSHRTIPLPRATCVRIICEGEELSERFCNVCGQRLSQPPNPDAWKR